MKQNSCPERKQKLLLVLTQAKFASFFGPGVTAEIGNDYKKQVH
jgi:hypothetical protein